MLDHFSFSFPCCPPPLIATAAPHRLPLGAFSRRLINFDDMHIDIRERQQ